MMTQDNQSSIKDRWWFKLVRLFTVGIFRGIASLVRGFRRLGTKAKLAVGGTFVALVIILGIAGQQESQRAKDMGFASVAEMHQAEKVNCSDKACYDKYMLAQQQAEEAKVAKSEQLSADAEAPADANVLAGSSEEPDAGAQSSAAYAGNDPGDPRFWREGCKVWARAKMECTGNSDYEGCISSRMASAFGYENKDIGLGAGTICNEDGSTFLNLD